MSRGSHSSSDLRSDSQARLDDPELIENPMYGVGATCTPPVAASAAAGVTSGAAVAGDRKLSHEPPPPSVKMLPTCSTGAATRLPASKDDRLHPCVSERCGSRRWSATGSSARPDPTRSSQQPPPAANRTDRLKSYVRDGTCQFFGVDEADTAVLQTRWLERRRRMAARVYGRLKDDDAASGMPQMALPADDVDFVGARPPCRKLHVAVITWRGLACLARYLAVRCGIVADDAAEIAEPSREQHPSLPQEQRRCERTLSRSIATAPASLVAARAGVSGGATTAAASSYDELDRGRLLAAPVMSRPDPRVTDEVFFDRVPCHPEAASVDFSERRKHLRDSAQWQRHVTADRGVDDLSRPRDLLGHKRISSRLLDSVFDNSNRRQFGQGLAGKLFGGWTLRRSVARRADVKQQVDDMDDHRPYFTYWVTVVQVLIMLLSLACYGFGPVGFELKQQSGRVLDTSLSLQQVDYWEPPNIWLGPRAADLIHLGAKFAPCMRRDQKINANIRTARNKERFTACCIRNDNSGCVQSARAECSNLISTWDRWGEPGQGPEGRMYGSVCGLDPRFCSEPRSRAPYEWPQDITKWPICRKTTSAPKGVSTVEHMMCEVVGHPCCVGIHGRCQITTREYCNFVHGFFHEEAALCSQVSCLDDVCGMMPFFDPDTPDQFYRLWTSLFLHAGLIHLFFTVMIQFFFLRDLEKMAGPVRTALIYIVSGVGGNLASAIFVPYRAEVGPAGCQFGLLACHFVELINAWPMLRRPWRPFARLSCLTLALFVVGLLPWVDNYAHLFGFLVGFLLSYALLPYVTFGPYDGARKKLLIGVCVTAVLLLLLFLLVLFYVTPFYECRLCEYLNCVPLTRDFCAEQDIEFNRHAEL